MNGFELESWWFWWIPWLLLILTKKVTIIFNTNRFFFDYSQYRKYRKSFNFSHQFLTWAKYSVFLHIKQKHSPGTKKSSEHFSIHLYFGPVVTCLNSIQPATVHEISLCSDLIIQRYSNIYNLFANIDCCNLRILSFFHSGYSLWWFTDRLQKPNRFMQFSKSGKFFFLIRYYRLKYHHMHFCVLDFK